MKNFFYVQEGKNNEIFVYIGVVIQKYYENLIGTTITAIFFLFTFKKL